MHHDVFIRTAAALLVCASASSAFAQSTGEAQRQAYLRGDTHASPAPMARLVPGPNARQLIYLGVDADEAIARTRRMGEQAVVKTAAPASTNTRVGFDLYDRIAARDAAAMQQAMR